MTGRQTDPDFFIDGKPIEGESIFPELDRKRPKLPNSDLTLTEARAKLSGWHFAKEALSDGEREILYVAETLLRLIDVEAGGWRPE